MYKVCLPKMNEFQTWKWKWTLVIYQSKLFILQMTGQGTASDGHSFDR